jgi:hypothetical protein
MHKGVANYRSPLLCVMTHSMCSSVSVVNTYISVMVLMCFIFQLLSLPFFFTGQRSADLPHLQDNPQITAQVYVPAFDISM